ncbi:toll-like receptor 7 [Clavelina lepadiformis]|uniref:toll-like receptor 7 n=1 Tax=Clavelina lepadiformis TaxID=159417 RepID=UPI0040434350
MPTLFVALLGLLVLQAVNAKNLLNPCEPALFRRGTEILDLKNYLPDRIIPLSKVFHWLHREFFFVTCSGRALIKVPQILNSDVEALDLSNNMIRRLASEDLSRYSKIEVLLLGWNCVTFDSGQAPKCKEGFYIEPGALAHLSKLKWLEISHNFIREFPQRLPPSIIGLDVGSANLPDISSDLEKLSNLKSLIASANCFPYEASLCQGNFTLTKRLPPKMEFVSLLYNSWERIPGEILNRDLSVFLFRGNLVANLRRDDFLGSPHIKILDLSFIAIAELTVETGVFDHLAGLKFLNLSGNFITFLPNDFFKYNSHLEILDLSANCLKRTIFEGTYLTNLYWLRHLDLSFNKYCLDYTPAGEQVVSSTLRLGPAYSTLASLGTFILGSNNKVYLVSQEKFSVEIPRIDSESFASLKNLSVVEFAKCKLHHISADAWSNLPLVKSVYASNNYLNLGETVTKKRKIIFSDGFKRTFEKEGRSLVLSDIACEVRNVIDYSNNRITSIPKTQLLSTTTVLDLSHNEIIAIRKDDLNQTKSLCRIDLSNNPLQNVDAGSFQTLSNLHEIDLRNIGTGLDDFSFFCNLDPSTLVYARMRAADTSIGGILALWLKGENCNATSIGSMDISQNNLELMLFPWVRAFEAFPAIRVLQLQNCELVSPLPKNFFDGLCYLKNLNLGYNNLNQFPAEPMKHLTRLNGLLLHHNKLSELKGNLSFLPNLTSLVVSNNRINFIQAGFFKGLRLHILDLSYNYISKLDPYMFSQSMLYSLQEVDLRWNELDCSCYIWTEFYKWYISDASNHVILNGIMPTCTPEMNKYYGGCVACQSPQGLHGLSVSRYGYNTSCDFYANLANMLSFTAIILVFMLSGSVGYSTWFKRKIFRKVNEFFRVQSLRENSVGREDPSNVFVFFDLKNNELGDWVDYKLVPGLEERKPSFEVRLIGRDNACGAAPTQQLIRLVTKSHKTIVFLSGNFCNTPTCRFMMNVLQELQHSAGKDKLILVEWRGEEPARVPETIQQTFNRRFYNYLRFDQTNDDELMFVETLKTALLCSWRPNVR